MSKLYSKYLELKKDDSKTVYLFKSGIFFIALQEDATLLSEELNFKITNFTPEIIKCGFPVSRQEHYFKLLEAKNINFKVLDDKYGVIENYSDYMNNSELKDIINKIININFDEITLEKIEKFIAENLNLELNSKSRYYPCNQGVNFCGFRIWPTHRLLRKHCKTKIKRHINKWNKFWENGELDFNIAMPSIQSWIGHASHCNSYNFKNKVLHKAKFIYNEDVDYGLALSDIGYDDNLKYCENYDDYDFS